MAWSHEMKRYGKGTGKYAYTHLCQAQEALKEARSAVPVWIMPLHRAAQMFFCIRKPECLMSLFLTRPASVT